MGNQIPITQSVNLPDGREIILETGKLATQAHGSVVLRMGDTMIFASVVSNKEAKEGQPFFPLSVDYQEKFAAAGRIPGNFFKREARLSSNEILICRLIDRAIRPLFPDGYMNETQVMVNLISGEEEILPDSLAAFAVSTALTISDIPWAGPLSEVRVAKINGEYKVNPLKSELENATLDIIVAATLNDVMMVEGEASECQESELIEAIKTGHEAIKIQCQAQLDLREKMGDLAKPKRETVEVEINDELMQFVANFSKDRILETARAALDKATRKDQFQTIQLEMLEKLEADNGEEYYEEHSSTAKEYFDKLKKELIREMVLAEKVRLDGRKYDEVRPIWSEIDYLPSTHGSAIFNRGETQTLCTVTLGTKLDEMLVDDALELKKDNFFLHYNFPAFSVGEVKPNRGPGRREIGHANLAARSIRQVLPDEQAYTIRVVSDVLESNGSSSMATVCGASLSLMDAGIQISAPVSGIAMGMISDGQRHAILSDILGDEDALGDMDFKVTGTEKGITACQMDIKLDGLSYEVLEQALNQAKDGRIHILGEMAKTIDAPREDLKPHAPRIVEMRIDKSFIGAVIGPGGKVIQELQKETGTTINIEEVGEEGIINIASNNGESLAMAKAAIEEIIHVPEVGDIYEAEIESLVPFGAFVTFKKHKGLLHISEISHSRIEDPADVFKVGDPVKVKLIGFDRRSGKMKLSRKALMPRLPGQESEDNGRSEGRRDRRDDRRDDRRRGGRDRRDDRRGHDRRRDDRRDDRRR